MKGWIIYSENETEIVSERNEVNRFIEEAKAEEIELRVLKPEQIDLVVTSQNRKSILVDGEITTLPDFVLPRMGAWDDVFCFSGY